MAEDFKDDTRAEKGKKCGILMLCIALAFVMFFTSGDKKTESDVSMFNLILLISVNQVYRLYLKEMVEKDDNLREG